MSEIRNNQFNDRTTQYINESWTGPIPGCTSAPPVFLIAVIDLHCTLSRIDIILITHGVVFHLLWRFVFYLHGSETYSKIAISCIIYIFLVKTFISERLNICALKALRLTNAEETCIETLILEDRHHKIARSKPIGILSCIIWPSILKYYSTWMVI
jgi:hypothetical protein